MYPLEPNGVYPLEPNGAYPTEPPAEYNSDPSIITSSLDGINQEKYKQSYGTFFDNNHFILNPRSEHLAPQSYYPTERNTFSNFDDRSLGRTLPPYKFIVPLQSSLTEESAKSVAGKVATEAEPWWEAPALAALTAQTKPAEASIRKESPSPRAIFGSEFEGQVSEGLGVKGSGSGILAAQLLYKQIKNQESLVNLVNGLI